MIWLLLALLQAPAEPANAPRADYVFVHADAGDELVVFVDAGTVQRPQPDGSVYGYMLIAGPGVREDAGPLLLTAQADCRGRRLRIVSGRTLGGDPWASLSTGYEPVAQDAGGSAALRQLCAGRTVPANARRYGSAEAAADAATSLLPLSPR